MAMNYGGSSTTGFEESYLSSPVVSDYSQAVQAPNFASYQDFVKSQNQMMAASGMQQGFSQTGSFGGMGSSIGMAAGMATGSPLGAMAGAAAGGLTGSAIDMFIGWKKDADARERQRTQENEARKWNQISRARNKKLERQHDVMFGQQQQDWKDKKVLEKQQKALAFKNVLQGIDAQRAARRGFDPNLTSASPYVSVSVNRIPQGGF